MLPHKTRCMDITYCYINSHDTHLDNNNLHTLSLIRKHSAYILFVDSNTIKRMNLDGTGVENIHYGGTYSIIGLDYHYRLVAKSVEFHMK